MGEVKDSSSVSPHEMRSRNGVRNSRPEPEAAPVPLTQVRVHLLLIFERPNVDPILFL